MLLKNDPGCYFKYRLTEAMSSPDRLDFAIKPFINDKKNHCVIKHTKYGYAVFIKRAKHKYNKEDKNG